MDRKTLWKFRVKSSARTLKLASTRLFLYKNAWKGQSQLPRSCICAVPELTHDPLGEVSIQSTRKRQGWVFQSESTRTHRHTNHTHPLPNTEKCNLKVSDVCGKENKAAPPPPSAPFPHFPNSLQPDFPLEEGINGDSLQSFT